MGRSYLFECPRCGYKAKVSGGADEGLNFHVQTILCRDCNALYDAVTCVRISALPGSRFAAGFQGATLPRPVSERPPGFESALNRLRFLEGDSWRWIQYRLRCPVSPAHKVRTWSKPDKCPRCGTYLERNALPFRIWD